MPLNPFTPRRLSAVGAAALVAVSTLAVGAFAQTGDVDPGQASAAAVPPEASSSEDFFDSSPEADGGDRDLEQRRSQAEQRVDRGTRSAGGEGEAVHEPAPEPEEPSTTESPEPSAPSGGGDTASAPDGSAQEIALEMVLDEGWDADEFHNCLEPLWDKESNWNHTAENSSSGAYGIPQSLPGDKMASHGDDWETNPATQISWGLSYIKDRYGSPCEAWSHSQANNWY
ncbi:aggregation-promoting factor C-terminal-like domain-containing protein [Nocardiopsis salina]|uniref:aggregation-promoting factor C-terminal-like domain-containing protein n=1 Tax=Nocardiopsis salina TaxID=245836 RepID=UPI00034999E3|nr:lytic transglycosylase domain-containing protein [Nocardiopsis salina]